MTTSLIVGILEELVEEKLVEAKWKDLFNSYTNFATFSMRWFIQEKDV